MEIIVSIATIVAGIVALIQLLDYVNKPEKRNTIQLILVIGVAGVFMAFALNYLYFGPKSAGERFSSALRNVNARSMQREACTDSKLYEVFGQTSLLFDIGGSFTTVRISNESFTPLSNQYTFDWIFTSQMAGQKSPTHATLHIKAVDFTNFCIDNASGL